MNAGIANPLVWLWIGLAAYGIAVQALNLRWVWFTRQVIAALHHRTESQWIAVQGHVRINIMRSVAVVGNLAVGLISLSFPGRSAHLQALIEQSMGPLGGLFSVVFAFVFLLNEVGWDGVITLELWNRRRLRKLAGA